jgi:acetyltransferase-like isoleucine patch superfamily enzyme
MKKEDKIEQTLKELYTLMRTDMKARFDRDLPFEELLFNRWERAKNLGFAEGANIYHNSYVYGDVQVGKKTWIGPYTILDGSGSLKIGDFCSISAGVHIYTHDTVKWALSGGNIEGEKAPVAIGDCCYIGPQAIITKGVTIGSYCVIGAQSLVNGNVPPYSVVAGTPAKCIGNVRIENDNVHLEYFS